MKKAFALLAIVALTVGPLVGFSSKVKSANVTAYIDLVRQAATAPATISSQPEVLTSTASNFYISYVASTTQFAAANTVTISVPTAFTALALCSSPVIDSDGDATTDGATTLSGSTFTFTYTAATTLAITTGVEFCFNATTPAANGNYSISVSDNNDSDVSAALIYVGTTAAADTNDVTVSATVPVVLSLVIKNPTTTANINTCNLGILNPASVSTCSYRIAAGTNGTGGMNVQTVANGLLVSGGNDINNVADAAVTAGSEEHGVAMTAGTGWTLIAPFNTGDNPITTTQQKFQNRATVVDDSVTTNWTTVTHKASITSSTVTGAYTQVDSYRAYSLI
jgi:hypothetical protein